MLPLMTRSRPPVPKARESINLTLFSRAAWRTSKSLSDIESPTHLDGVGLRFETKKPRCVLNPCVAQERSNGL